MKGKQRTLIIRVLDSKRKEVARHVSTDVEVFYNISLGDVLQLPSGNFRVIASYDGKNTDTERTYIIDTFRMRAKILPVYVEEGAVV